MEQKERESSEHASAPLPRLPFTDVLARVAAREEDSIRAERSNQRQWTCPRCTFSNSPLGIYGTNKRQCAMCYHTLSDPMRPAIDAPTSSHPLSSVQSVVPAVLDLTGGIIQSSLSVAGSITNTVIEQLSRLQQPQEPPPPYPSTSSSQPSRHFSEHSARPWQAAPHNERGQNSDPTEVEAATAILCKLTPEDRRLLSSVSISSLRTALTQSQSNG